MSGIYRLCWGLLLFNGLYSTACNYTDVSTAAPPTNVTKATPVTVNCTSLHVQVLHVTPLNDDFLYIGSTATVRVSINLPVGLIERFYIIISNGMENIDFNSKKIYHKGNMDYTYIRFVRRRYLNTSFHRIHRLRYVFYDITTSYSNSTENQLFCDFYVYLHNAKGLQEGQNISIYTLVSYQWNGIDLIECPLHQLNFTTRALLLNMNKTASFAMVSPKTSELLSEINQLTKVTFKAWVPDYNPLIKVLLQRHTDSLWIAYLRVLSIGLSFQTKRGDIGLLKVSSCGNETSLLLDFPSHWVNRDYYELSNTTDSDMIKFEAGILGTESAALESEQKFAISILFNDHEMWNSTVSFIVNSTNENTYSLVKMSIVDELVNRAYASSTIYIPLKLIIATPPNMAETLDIILWTGNLSGTGEPAAIVKNVSFYSADSGITCSDLNTFYNITENTSVQNVALIHLKYVNLAASNISNKISLTFEVNIRSESINLTDNYDVVFVAAGNVTSTYKIILKIPEILNDRNNSLLRQFYKLLDGDNNTCVDLPVNGDFPPLFWTRVHTTWFRINASPFEMTLIGKEISCQGNGYMTSQVSFPTSSSKDGFHGALNLCNVTYSGDMNRTISKCVYSCQCKNNVECSEVILFMVNHENASVWNLCELSAVNV